MDIAVTDETEPPAFFELKCGSGKDALGPCAWDTLKLALALRMGDCSRAYLIAATRKTWFDQAVLGTELLADTEWSAVEIRERYASWFRHFQKLDDPPPLRLPNSGRIRAVGATSFPIGPHTWRLAVSRVEVDPEDGWYEWQPLEL